MRICGQSDGRPEPDGGWPPEITPCCYGYANAGWRGCTCWVPIFNVDPCLPPTPEHVELLTAGIEPNTRPQMCGDCAYRPGSPEKSGDETYQGDADFLEQIAETGDRFWCHQGLLVHGECVVPVHWDRGGWISVWRKTCPVCYGAALPLSREIFEMLGTEFAPERSQLARWAHHTRERMFILAHSVGFGCRAGGNDSRGAGAKATEVEDRSAAVRDHGWTSEPRICRVAYGVPGGVDRRRGLGNAVVPQVAEHVGRLVMAGSA